MDGPNSLAGGGVNTEKTRMNGALQVLVVARYRDVNEAHRILGCLSRQTHQNTRLVFVRRDEKDGMRPPENPLEICSGREFLAYLDKSGAEKVLFWPDEGDLKEAA